MNLVLNANFLFDQTRKALTVGFKPGVVKTEGLFQTNVAFSSFLYFFQTSFF